jgi:outer membrane lipoprotein-sorting protein
MQLMPEMTTRSDIRPVRYHAFRRRSTTRRSVGQAFTPAIISLACLGLTVALTAQSKAPPDPFDQLFARTLAKRDTMKSIRAKFTETTVSTLLAKPLVARGTVIAAPPTRVLMTYAEPERRIVLIDGTSLVVVWPDRNQRETIDIGQMQKRIDQYFTQASVNQLRGMFDITAVADPTMRDTDRVEMRPKRKQIKQGLEKLELWIERESLLLAQMRMAFPGGDTKTIRLEDLTENVPISDDTFKIPR